MVRAPCCEKMGLKKGPWTRDEDQILTNYIQQHGHSNWRALPKQAGLSRCGKSCRLRWINYLRPDIKRGNFSREEEETIIKMHEALGNRWSVIAASLPGRTDNEIKNVWHTHLKKRLQNVVTPSKKKRSKSVCSSKLNQKPTLNQEPQKSPRLEGFNSLPISPPQCSSDISSVTSREDIINNNMFMKVDSSDEFVEIDENFWSEVLSEDNSSSVEDIPVIGEDPQHQLTFSSLVSDMELVQCPFNLDLQDSLDYWYNLFTEADQEIAELPKM